MHHVCYLMLPKCSITEHVKRNTLQFNVIMVYFTVIKPTPLVCSLLLTLVRGSIYTLTLVLDYRCSYMAAISVKNRFEIQATLTIWVQVAVIGG